MSQHREHVGHRVVAAFHARVVGRGEAIEQFGVCTVAGEIEKPKWHSTNGMIAAPKVRNTSKSKAAARQATTSCACTPSFDYAALSTGG